MFNKKVQEKSTHI